jgi:hypothetical protein
VIIGDISPFAPNKLSAGDYQLPAHAQRAPLAAIICRGGNGVNRILVPRFVIAVRPRAAILLGNTCIEFRSL